MRQKGMMKLTGVGLLLFLLMACPAVPSSSYYPLKSSGTIENVQYYRTGNTSPIEVVTSFGLVLGGGGADVQEAFDWMLEKSGKGDFVVIRADDSDGYNDDKFIRGANSITTLILDSRTKADTAFVAQILGDADAVFIAGGDQTAYYENWKDTKVEEMLEYLLSIKKIPVGGTSAGMHILGGFAYIPNDKGVLSSEALKNPYHAYMDDIVDDFLDISFMKNVLTDTHWSERDRLGRTLAMMARLIEDGRVAYNELRAMAVDEATAVVIDENGQAQILGSRDWNDYAYFFQANSMPNTCEKGKALDWKDAVLVYRVRGYEDGRNTFNLMDWSGSGGEWLNVNVNNGVIDNDIQKSSK